MLRLVWVLASVSWAAATVTGFAVLSRFETTPGPAEPAPSAWPAGSGIERTPGRPTLVMFAHPRCPCTGASLHELERLLVHAGEVDPWIVIGAEGPSENRDRAGAIPGVRVLEDPAGAEAARFGGLTSGHVVVYGPDGGLRFSGGITAGRGHEGDNNGSDAALAAVLAREGAALAPVFGCKLQEDVP